MTDETRPLLAQDHITPAPPPLASYTNPQAIPNDEEADVEIQAEEPENDADAEVVRDDSEGKPKVRMLTIVRRVSSFLTRLSENRVLFAPLALPSSYRNFLGSHGWNHRSFIIRVHWE
jgi:hypothetical protein